MLIDRLGLRVSTAGAGNAAAALYRNKAGRPGALVGNTGAMGTAAVASMNMPMVQGDQVVEPGFYWVAANMDNTAAALFCAVATSANTILSALIGSTSQTVAMTAQGFGGLTTPSAFGTWPADLSGAALTEVTAARCATVGFRTGALP